jgi:serine phosphatase RsbU (regulator of sigma subunit)
VLIVAVGCDLANPSLLREMRERGFDLEQTLWPRPAGSVLVPVVAIDEESLRRYGQWPWPRALVADLVRRIAAGKPAVLGVDILFSEPDRFSPPQLAKLPDLALLAEQLARMPSGDSRLAEAFSQVPSVLGMAPTDEPRGPSTAPRRLGLVREAGGDPRLYLTPYNSLIETLPEIARAARAEAALTSEPDADGVVRGLPLLTLVHGTLFPALAVEMVRVAAAIPSVTVTTGRLGIESLGLGPLTLPTDGRGRARLHFAPPKARYVSAAQVLDPAFNVRQFSGQIVLLGVTGLGIVDRISTPLGLADGIDLQAQLIESMLAGTLLHRPPEVFWIELAIVLAAGLAVLGLVRFNTPQLAAGVALGIAAGLLGGEFALFRFAASLVDGIYPAIVALTASAGLGVGHLRASQTARRRLAADLEHERQRQARNEGELAAARELQMGLLPLRFPAFPQRGDLDLYGRIEPARAVGGDFFDFLLIENNSLFFIVADVAGKGVPAALYMATTMQLVRAAVQRHGPALERIIAEVNAEMATASAHMGRAGDGMFVTAFAGIVNLATGTLDYISAGHDSPFLVSQGQPVRQLETAGGPPLGLLAKFPFPVSRFQWEAGTILMAFTDGLTEACDASGELYSAARVAIALAAARTGHAQAVVDSCFEALRRFAGDTEPADDITVLAIRRKGVSR